MIVLVAVLIFQNEPPQKTNAEHFNKQDVAQVESQQVSQAATPQVQQKVEVKPPEPPAPTPPPQPQAVAPPVITDPKSIAQHKAAQRGWTGYQWQALVDLWHKESGWNPNAVNRSSGACGIPQALPCSKIPNPSDVNSQIEWGLNYIAGYGSPAQALAFWNCTGSCYSTRTKTTVNKVATWY